MNVYRYETPKEVVFNQKGPVIFLAGPTVRGNQLHLTSWRFKAIELFKEYGFTGTLVVPEFTDITESDKGRVELPIWEHNGLTRADCILFWIPRTRELWGLNTNSEHGYWLGKDPLKLVYGRPDDAFRIQYNDIMHNRIYFELGTERPIYNTLEDTIKASIEMVNSKYEKINKETEIREYLLKSMFGNKEDDSIFDETLFVKNINSVLNEVDEEEEYIKESKIEELLTELVFQKFKNHITYDLMIDLGNRGLVDIKNFFIEKYVLNTLKHEKYYKIFIKYKKAWQEEVMFISNSTKILENENYIKIIEMGDIAIRLILHDIYKNGPYFWHEALKKLSGENLIIEEKDAGKIKLICDKWLKWGNENKINYEFF